MAGGRFPESSCAAASEGAARLGRPSVASARPQPWVRPPSALCTPQRNCSGGKLLAACLSVTGKQDVVRRAPENNNLPPGSLLRLFPRYISRLGGTNHREAPARWPPRRVTGRESQWPGLDFFPAEGGGAEPARGSFLPRHWSPFLYFFLPRGPTAFENSGGARDNGSRPDTPARSPASTVLLRGLSVSGVRAGAGGERVAHWRGVGEGARPGGWGKGRRSLAGGGARPRPSVPPASGCWAAVPARLEFKGLAPPPPAPPRVLQDPGLPSARL